VPACWRCAAPGPGRRGPALPPKQERARQRVERAWRAWQALELPDAAAFIEERLRTRSATTALVELNMLTNAHPELETEQLLQLRGRLLRAWKDRYAAT